MARLTRAEEIARDAQRMLEARAKAGAQAARELAARQQQHAAAQAASDRQVMRNIGPVPVFAVKQVGTRTPGVGGQPGAGDRAKPASWRAPSKPKG